MKWLDFVVRTPVSEALGWTLLHSFWEELLIAAALASVLGVVRSSRIRYRAGYIALLTTLVSFSLTLIYVFPRTDNYTSTLIQTARPPWRELPEASGTTGGFPGMGLLIPWLAPLWLAGSAFSTCTMLPVGCPSVVGVAGVFFRRLRVGRVS